MEVEINEEMFTLRRADPNAIIFVSDEEPQADDTLSTAVYGERKTREVYE
jgi:hypothetical protein